MRVQRVNSKEEKVTAFLLIRILRHHFSGCERCLCFGSRGGLEKWGLNWKEGILKISRNRKPISFVSLLLLFLILSISWNFQFAVLQRAKRSLSTPHRTASRDKFGLNSYLSDKNGNRTAHSETLGDTSGVDDDVNFEMDHTTSFASEESSSNVTSNGSELISHPISDPKRKDFQQNKSALFSNSDSFHSSSSKFSKSTPPKALDSRITGVEKMDAEKIGPANASEYPKSSKFPPSSSENRNSVEFLQTPNASSNGTRASPLKNTGIVSLAVNVTNPISDLPINLTFVPEETWGQNWNWTDIRTWQQRMHQLETEDPRFDYSNWSVKVESQQTIPMINISEAIHDDYVTDYASLETTDQGIINESVSILNVSESGNHSTVIQSSSFNENESERNIFENFLGLVGGSIRWSSSKITENVKQLLFYEKLSRKTVYEFHIPGTRIKTLQKVKRVKSILNCLATNGEWVFNDTPRQIPWDLHPPLKLNNPDYRTCDFLWVESGGLYGSNAEKIQKNPRKWKVRLALKHEWKSTSNSRCSFRKFDRTKFCEAVGQRNILLVGDSMQLQFHNAILNHVVTNKTSHSAGIMGDARYPCMGHDLCGDILGGKGFHFRARRNDRLTRGNGDVYDNMQWIEHIQKYRIEILILNRGAHFRENDIFLREMRVILQLLRSKFPNLLIIWRNTPPGHPHCFAKKYRVPLKKRLTLQEMKFYFGWDKFQSQNEVARSLMEEFGVVYMDVDHATSLRPDGHFQKFKGHRDCLHYCSPGPVDFWVHLLYNVLVELNNQ